MFMNFSMVVAVIRKTCPGLLRTREKKLLRLMETPFLEKYTLEDVIFIT